jgi:hypothetical protein
MSGSARDKATLAAFGVGIVIAAMSSETAAQKLPNFTPALDPTVVAPGDVFSNTGPDEGMAITHEGPFDPSSGDVLDGCVPATDQNHPTWKLLRFSLRTQNDGYDTAIVDGLPSPSTCPQETRPACCIADHPNTDTYVWSHSHCHYHLRNFANFQVIDTSTKAHILSGQKYGFALQDSGDLVYRCDAPLYSLDYPGAQSCSPPALSPSFTNPFPYTPTGGTMWVDTGSYDLYGLSMGCQYIQIDDLADGTYDLVVQVNSGRTVVEGRISDNTAVVRFSVSGDALTTFPPTWDSSAHSLVPATGISQSAAVVSRLPNSYDVFYVGTDGVLYTVSQDAVSGAWSNGLTGPGTPLSNPATPLIGPPAAVALAPDRLLILARQAIDGSVYVFDWGAAGSIPGYPTGPMAQFFGGPGAGPPAIVASSPQSVLAAWVQSDGTIQYRDLHDFGAGGFIYASGALDGTFATDQTPAVTASGAGMFHLFVRDALGAAWYQRFDHGTGWRGWTSIGGSLVGSLSAASSYLNQVDVFARGSDNSLQQDTWNGSAFSGWSNNGFSDVGSAPSAISTGARTLDVAFYKQSDPTWYYDRHFDGTTWTTKNLNRLFCVVPGVPVVMASWGASTLDLFQELCDGTITDRSLR